MRKLTISTTSHEDGSLSICIGYRCPILVNLLSTPNMTDISIYDVTKEELEYMASELKRIADTMEG
jgi:hypothetical protein